MKEHLKDIGIAHETIYNEPDVVKGAELDSNENEKASEVTEEEVEEVDPEIDLEDDDSDEGVPLSIRDLMMGNQDEEEPEDYVEEKTNADGTHIRKEVHQGNGFKSIRITSDGGSGGAIPEMFGGGSKGGIPNMMAAMM